MNALAPIRILLAEDDPGHARLIQRNLRRGGFSNEITNVANGRAALRYIDEARAATPAGDRLAVLLLLDLNMPVMDGFEVLQALKSSEDTRHVPVIVLTTTDVPDEVDRCYALGCNVFVTKPVGYESFSEAVRRLGLLLSVMALPDAAA